MSKCETMNWYFRPTTLTSVRDLVFTCEGYSSICFLAGNSPLKEFIQAARQHFFSRGVHTIVGSEVAAPEEATPQRTGGISFAPGSINVIDLPTYQSNFTVGFPMSITEEWDSESGETARTYRSGTHYIRSIVDTQILNDIHREQLDQMTAHAFRRAGVIT